MAGEGLSDVVEAVRTCRLCHSILPLGARPVLRVSTMAKLLVIYQAPGTRAHARLLPFNDASGDRLRAWMGIGLLAAAIFFTTKHA